MGFNVLGLKEHVGMAGNKSKPWSSFQVLTIALTAPLCLRRSVGQSLNKIQRNAASFVSRGTDPWRTQLRKVPTESRDPEVFVEEAVPDGATVDVLQLAGNFAEVRTATGCQGWVQRRYLHGLSNGQAVRQVKRVEVEEMGDNEPLVLVDAVPSVKGWKGLTLPRMQRLIDIMDSVQLRCNLAADELRLASRCSPRFLRYALATPPTPIILGAWPQELGHITFRSCSSDLLRSLDLIGYLSLPGDILLDVVPREVLPPGPGFTCAMLGAGADLFLCRHPTICGHSISVLAGHLTVRLLPPHAAGDAPDALIGELGASLSQCNLFDNKSEVIVEAELREGDVLLIPPGWWHQCLSLQPTTLAIKSYMNKDMIIPAWQHMVGMLKLEQEKEALNASVLLKTLQSLAPQKMGISAWPFWPQAVKGSHDDRLRNAQPGFLYSGMVLPTDANLWTDEELVRFVATAGFISPPRRWPLTPRRAPSRLREWLETPIDQGQLPMPSGEAPRVIWMYWAQGYQQLTGFRRLCVHTWCAKNPEWKVVILDKDTLWSYVDPSELPKVYKDLPAAQQSDALRLALLAKYGGVYTDVATICLQPLEDWLWEKVCDGPLERGLGAWYLACFGMDPGVSKEYVENWFLAARRHHPLIVAWHDLYNAGWENARTRHEYPLGPLFRDVDLSHISIAEHRDWLLMHVCFKKLIDENSELRRIWAEQITLLKADEGALAWMADVDADRPEDTVRFWISTAQRQSPSTPMLKFVGDAAQALQWQPDEHIVDQDNCLTRVR
eukprot:symbB.v1.2.020600.t1/scaffold1743.1/size123518/1